MRGQAAGGIVTKIDVDCGSGRCRRLGHNDSEGHVKAHRVLGASMLGDSMAALRTVAVAAKLTFARISN